MALLGGSVILYDIMKIKFAGGDEIWQHVVLIVI